MNMNRVILHSDINHCFAQIEEMLNPELKKIPMAIGGSEEARHGIILAKNLKTKPFQIKTAESIREALRKCPNLTILPPRSKLYEYYSERVKDIYREYSDKVESFGLDEAWIDVTHSQQIFGSGYEIAKKIQERVFDELGLTVSIGVSFNKVFAKLGSDIIKPSGLVVISPENYKDVAWPLPVEDLFLVGYATKKKLNDIGIYTIGELAQMPLKMAHRYLGKNGLLIYTYANGGDQTNVSVNSYRRQPKSVGNSWTAPKDIRTFEEAKIVLKVLSESVASRLKDEKLQGSVISVSIRNKALHTISRQEKRKDPTDLSKEIFDIVTKLVKQNHNFKVPIRSMGVSASGLSKGTQHLQLNLFEDVLTRDKERNVEIVIDNIRNKFGFDLIKNTALLVDKKLSDFNPKGSVKLLPGGFHRGND